METACTWRTVYSYRKQFLHKVGDWYLSEYKQRKGRGGCGQTSLFNKPAGHGSTGVGWWRVSAHQWETDAAVQYVSEVTPVTFSQKKIPYSEIC
jgi:hypothetical protein